MTYKEAVIKKITGEGEERNRRRDLWAAIIKAYEQGGEDAIKASLVECSHNITDEFDTLLKKLRDKL